jgi:hydroxyacylglutathione hydrolase
MSWTMVDTRSGERPVVAFTGDALFVGDTGRTDLLGEDERPRLSSALHDSVFGKLLPLGDHVILCAGHGGGSVCGGSILERDESTLGHERLFNPSLQVSERAAFERAKLEERHLKAPNMEARIEPWNTAGRHPSIVCDPEPTPLDLGPFTERMEQGAQVLDVRMPQAFAAGHIPGSVNIWRQGVQAYLGWVVPTGQDVLLVTDDDDEVPGLLRELVRIGWDEVAGHLRGGFESWQNAGRPLASFGTIDTEGLRSRLRKDEVLVLDVRKPDEWEEGTLEDAQQVFVGHLQSRLDELPRDRPLVTMCSVGHRAGIAASLLKREGFEQVHNYLGGYTAWSQQEQG